ncbi:MAG: MFS transporter [Chloroflexi bacterium]|nr:MFS transporter [Chloroflexota bacterium]
MHSSKRSQVLFCLGTFLFWVSLYVYMPILPVYAESLGSTMTIVGLVVSSYGFAQLTLRIPLGIWSDRLGRRKPFVLAGLGVAGLAALGLGFAPNVWFLLGARTLTGLAAATWVPFTVLFASYFTQDRATRAISIIMFVTGLAEMVSTYLGGFIAESFGWQATFFSGAAFASVGILLMLRVQDRTEAVEQVLSLTQIKRIATVPSLIWISLLALLVAFISFGINFGFANVYAAHIGASKADLGTMTGLMFAAQAVATLLCSALVERTGGRFMVVAGLSLMGLANLAVPSITNVPLMTVYQAVSGMGRGLTRPVFMALSILAVPGPERATAMGVFQAVYAFGTIVGPALSGAWADSFGLPSVFIMAAAISLTGAALAVFKVPAK